MNEFRIICLSIFVPALLWIPLPAQDSPLLSTLQAGEIRPADSDAIEVSSAGGGIREDRSIYLEPGQGVVIAEFIVDDRNGLQALLDYRAGDPEPKSVDLVFRELDGQGNIVFEETGKVRLRGRSTRGARVKSFKVNLSKKGQLWKGQYRSLNLNKHPWDLSRIRNKLCFDLFEEVPDFTSLRTYFVHLTINGSPAGLYTFIENAKTRFLRSHGLDAEGQLYKANNFNFSLKELNSMKRNPTRFFEEEEMLELESGKEDHSAITDMLANLHGKTIDIDDFIDRYFDRENYLTWMAVNILLQNIDTVSQNYYLYSPSASDKWYFLPWDYDGALGKYEQDGSIDRWKYRLKTTMGLANYWRVPLHQRFFRKPANVADLYEKIDMLREEYFSDEKVSARIEEYMGRIYDIITRPPDLLHLGGVSKGFYKSQYVAAAKVSYDNEIQRLKGFISSNYSGYLSALEAPMPVFQSIEADSEGIRFTWDQSFDFQGDSLSYEFQLYRAPFMATRESKGTPPEEYRIYSEMLAGTTEFLLKYSQHPLAAGTYFWRVVVHDLDSRGALKGNWQIPYSKYWDGERDLFFIGLEAFSVSEDGSVWE